MTNTLSLDRGAAGPVNRLTPFGILGRWLVLGGFPNRPLTVPAGSDRPSREGYARDFLTALGGEAAAEFAPGVTVPLDGQDGSGRAEAIPVRVGLDGVLDFRRLFPNSDDRVAYAFCFVEHDRAELVKCEFGSDDSAKVWVNGVLVHQVWTPARGCIPGQEHFNFSLKRGRNRILIKIENYRGDWRFCLTAYTPATAAKVKRAIALNSSMRGHPAPEQAAMRPLFDRFGQYAHAEWPGKVTGLADMRDRRNRESAALRKDPGPRGWTVYGGWARGPALAATGYFRTERYQGKWWLVDPLGKLFFSHGIDHVTCGETTGLDDREAWFAGLPSAAGEFACCYGTARGLHGYYSGKSTRTFEFAKANLIRKYGPGWQEQFVARVHDRLRGWGLNTLGCWSEPVIYNARRTAYTVYLGSGGAKLAGSEGYWYPFSDVFDASFRESLRDRLRREVGESAGDPWCLGYFVDNELSWGEPASLAEATLRSPAGQAAKRAFLDDLRARYETIARLNRAWTTKHGSWEALERCTALPHLERAHEDLLAFGRRFADTYFRTCREAIKEVAPQQLYLGCRFSHAQPNHAMPAAAAAKHCDVVSYNLYEHTVADVNLPDDSDVPVVIGEFHFGALDRGLFHTGLREVASQEDRARTYGRYVRSVLANPRMVGCHWFQFRDSPTSGRVIDGENYQIGMLDVCDTPYRETIAAARQIGDSLYRKRVSEEAGRG